MLHRIGETRKWVNERGASRSPLSRCQGYAGGSRLQPSLLSAASRSR